MMTSLDCMNDLADSQRAGTLEAFPGPAARAGGGLDHREVFRRMCLIRQFEQGAAQASTAGLTSGPVYLSIGQESPSATISTLTKGYSVFAQHRCHSVYLAHGGDPRVLRDELLGRESGCCRGRGGSPCLQDLSIPLFGHHGLIGENIPLGTGYALATQKPTVIYFGDAAGEEDYALTSFGFAATHRLPVLYVCEDNDLSILTPIQDRRSWDLQEVVGAMGLPGATIDDDPQLIFDTTRELLAQLPAFITIKTCRHRWHAGAGTDGPPAWDRLALFRSTFPDADAIENQVTLEVDELWRKPLLKQ